MISRSLTCVITLLLLSFAWPLKSAGQSVFSYNPNDELFVREVKIIDEFIDRFNGADTGFVRKMHAQSRQYKITRDRLLISLFDLENTTLTQDSAVKGFFAQILDKQHPTFLSFADGDWYAAAQSVFLFKGRLVEIPLILHVKSKGNEWSKWMITGVGSAVPGKGPMPAVSVKPAGNLPQYISTSAYATDFAELHYILTGGMDASLFFEPQVMAAEKGSKFISLIKSGQLKFQYVRKITFHFYQVNGYIFTVDRFIRKSFNNGWLISSLHKVSSIEKNAARQRLLTGQ